MKVPIFTSWQEFLGNFGSSGSAAAFEQDHIIYNKGKVAGDF
jgi:hypothetical protein